MGNDQSGTVTTYNGFDLDRTLIFDHTEAAMDKSTDIDDVTRILEEKNKN